MTISNCISLDELRRMAVGDIAALPAEQLVLLQDEAADVVRQPVCLRDWRLPAVGGARLRPARKQSGGAPARQTLPPTN